MINVCTVDKGVGETWGFCRAQVWDMPHVFLVQEEYQETKQIEHEVQQFMLMPKAAMCYLHLITKAKSPTTVSNRNGCEGQQ